MKFCQWTKIYAFYRFFVRVTSWKKQRLVVFFLIYLKGELEVAYKSYVGRNSLYCYYDYCLLYLIWPANNEHFRTNPSHLLDNTDTLHLAEQHWQQTVLFFQIFIVLCSSVFLCVSQSVCLQVCMPSISSFKKTIITSPCIKKWKNLVSNIESVRLPPW